MKPILIGLGLITLATLILMLTLFLAGNDVAGVVVASVFLLLFLLFIILSSIALGFFGAREMMRAGAEIALRANEINDAWDTRKVQAYGAFGKSILNLIGKDNGQERLPPPSRWVEEPPDSFMVETFEELEK